jgi:hypothetical protein
MCLQLVARSEALNVVLSASPFLVRRKFLQGSVALILLGTVLSRVLNSNNYIPLR